jgi:hypothetical protein
LPAAAVPFSLLLFYIINSMHFLSLSPAAQTDRQKVLRHHPDKRKAAGEEVRADDDYFTCITKAYETLSVASKRRAYDSVDSEFDDDVPSSNAANKSRFFEVYTPFITREKTLIHSRKKKTLTNSPPLPPPSRGL